MVTKSLADVPGWIIAVVIVVGLWEAVWKAVALWRAGNDRNLLWFVLMFLLNTLGILEIVYVFGISRPRRRAGTGVGGATSSAGGSAAL